VHFPDREPRQENARQAGSCSGERCWEHADDAPTPGRANANSDSDKDGLPDWWEITYGTDPKVADAQSDPDGDGLTNLQEYVAGTNPKDAASVLKLQCARPAPDAFTLQFQALAGHSYSVLWCPQAHSTNWSKLLDVPTLASNQLFSATNSVRGQPARLFRIATPALP